MSNLYVACELGPDKGRVMLGALEREGLMLSEVADLQHLTKKQDGAIVWDIPHIYQQVIAAVRGVIAQEVPIRGISFHSTVADAILFEENGTPLAPATRPEEAAAANELNKILAKVPVETFYQEIGRHPSTASTLCQLVNEPGKRLKKANHAMGLGDSFNYLFSGVARTDLSQASQSQLYNPTTKAWSEVLLQASNVPQRLLPPLTAPGAMLGKVRGEVVDKSGLEDTQVITTCSNHRAAALAALHMADPEPWAFLWPDKTTLLGTRIGAPFINEVGRDMKFSNFIALEGCVGFYKKWTGLSLVDQCHQAWSQQDRALDNDVLLHLATSAVPFEALIDPAHPGFSSPPDMPQAIQAFCRETGQEAPRKPGPILRCILESLALHYRKGFLELEYLTGVNFKKLYVLGGQSNALLNHFLANALQVPVLAVPTDIAGVGNIAVQALALGHITSAEQAEELVHGCLKPHTINPHATAWTEAYDRFLTIAPA